MNTQNTYKRKLLNFSVKREMQFRMIGKIILMLFLSLFLSCLIFYFFADREVTSSYQMFHIKARNFLDFLLPAVVSSFLISLVLGASASLFFPKPIAGGIYRIEQDLQKVVEQGDLTLQIKLRNGDQVHSLASEINALLKDYRDRIIKFEKPFKDIERYVLNKTVASTEGHALMAKQACEQMREELRKLKY